MTFIIKYTDFQCNIFLKNRALGVLLRGIVKICL